jgi:hypothetical protein
MTGLSNDFERMKALREQTRTPEQPPAAPQVPERPEQPEMTRRSWYVTRDAADVLKAAVDDIHHRTRGIPKHVIASALFTAAAANADAVTRDLLARITSET